MRGIVTFLLSVLLLEIDTAVIGNDLCAINTYNGHCISKQRFMKENCPEYCEDFKSSAYKCEDDIDTDCAAVKAAGLCDPKEAQELSM